MKPLIEMLVARRLGAFVLSLFSLTLGLLLACPPAGALPAKSNANSNCPDVRKRAVSAEEAFNLKQKRADADAELLVGHHYYQTGDFDVAKLWYQDSAELGNKCAEEMVRQIADWSTWVEAQDQRNGTGAEFRNRCINGMAQVQFRFTEKWRRWQFSEPIEIAMGDQKKTYTLGKDEIAEISTSVNKCPKIPKVVVKLQSSTLYDGSQYHHELAYKNGEAKESMKGGQSFLGALLMAAPDMYGAAAQQEAANRQAQQAAQAQKEQQRAAAQQAELARRQAAQLLAAQQAAISAQNAAIAAQQAAARTQAQRQQQASANQRANSNPSRPAAQTRPSPQASDLGITQNYVGACNGGSTIAYYRITNMSYYSATVTVRLSYQTGGVPSSFQATQSIGPRSDNDFNAQIPCGYEADPSDYGHSDILQWQFLP